MTEKTFSKKPLNGKEEETGMSNIMEFVAVKQSSPIPLNGKVSPLRRRNSEVRSREYLTPDEVERLMDAAGKTGRHRHRDRTLILVTLNAGRWAT